MPEGLLSNKSCILAEWFLEVAMVIKSSIVSRSVALVFATILAANVPAPADTSLTINEPIPDTANIVVSDSDTLQKAGATSLSVFFDDPADGSNKMTAWLLGIKGDKPIWKTPLPLKEAVNLEKTDVVCKDGMIVVISQSPGSAAFFRQKCK
jgi:hypothetical protein